MTEWEGIWSPVRLHRWSFSRMEHPCVLCLSAQSQKSGWNLQTCCQTYCCFLPVQDDAEHSWMMKALMSLSNTWHESRSCISAPGCSVTHCSSLTTVEQVYFIKGPKSAYLTLMCLSHSGDSGFTVTFSFNVPHHVYYSKIHHYRASFNKRSLRHYLLY